MTTIPSTKRQYKLPITGRPAPKAPPWLHAADFLREAGASSVRTEKTYSTALRLLADWVQHHQPDTYPHQQSWPLDLAGLTTEMITSLNSWLVVHRAMRTARTYTAGILGYLHYLDARDLLTAGIQLGKINHHLKRSQKRPNQASEVVERDEARRDMPLAVPLCLTQLPACWVKSRSRQFLVMVMPAHAPVGRVAVHQRPLL